MKKYVILFLVGVFSLLSVSVFAQTETNSNPGMLPSSPFYFLKEWKRGASKMFTFDSVKKAELELKETDDRAAEIKKMEEINPENVNALKKAVENYQENTERLKSRLEGLSENSENPNIDELLNKVVDRSIEHQELFDALQEKLSSKEEIKGQLMESKEKIGEVVSKIPEKFENAEAFKERIEKRVENKIEEGEGEEQKGLNQLRAVKSLEILKGTLPKNQQKEIQDVRSNLMEKIENRLEDAERAEKIIILNASSTDAAATINKSASSTDSVKPLEGSGSGSGILTPIKTINEYFQEKKEQVEERRRDQSCVQVVTPAISSTGVCKEFSTPCEVPADWKITETKSCAETSAVKPSILPVVPTPSTGNTAPATQ